jgi:small subunit ribosomal protein S8
MLTRIRNANLVKRRKIKVIKSNLIFNVLSILKNEGFIESFEDSFDNPSRYLNVTLIFKGVNQKSYITKLKRISKPGLRVYVTNRNIPRILGGVGLAVCFKFCISYLI